MVQISLEIKFQARVSWIEWYTNQQLYILQLQLNPMHTSDIALSISILDSM